MHSASPAPSRIELNWRPPLDPRVHGYGTRIDPGGYCYRVFRDGRLAGSGTAGADLQAAKAHALRIAAGKGLSDPPVYVTPKP